MKINVKTLKGSHFEIEVKPEDSVADVKTIIETTQGSDVYPAAQQMLIYQGKVLKDPTTMGENNVVENGFLVIMLSKKPASAGPSTTAASPASLAAPPTPAPASTTPAAPAPATTTAAPAPSPAAAPDSTVTAATEGDVYGQAASNLVAGNTAEAAIQQILDMGGGTWDRDTVMRALRAAFNNPERAVDYLYSGIPEQALVPPVAQAPTTVPAVNAPAQAPQQTQPVPSAGPNANPLDLFPQGLPSVGSNAAGAGSLDFLRNSQQFQALRAMVQQNPQILQ
ncbi:hypothetical protein MKW94_003963, partial [Papaver nudicaule]|nr:hypothetical protein [Papaver nudicaule]MCL7044111.1 hypothetical protein [Papaver nudicaule]